MKAEMRSGQEASGARVSSAAPREPWLGPKGAEPLFEPASASERAFAKAEGAGVSAAEGAWVKKAGAAFGVTLIFLAGLGAGSMIAWTRGEAAGRAYQKAEQSEQGPWGAGPRPLTVSPRQAPIAPMGAPSLGAREPEADFSQARPRAQQPAAKKQAGAASSPRKAAHAERPKRWRVEQEVILPAPIEDSAWDPGRPAESELQARELSQRQAQRRLDRAREREREREIRRAEDEERDRYGAERR